MSGSQWCGQNHHHQDDVRADSTNFGRCLPGWPSCSEFDVRCSSLDFLCPDQPYLYEKLTGRDHLHFIRDIHGLDHQQADSHIASLIETFELHEFVDRLTESYSHGMRQRLSFATALLAQPKILVVDEPMVGLDPRNMRTVKDVLKKLTRAGMTVFMSTHTLSVAEELADRIGVFNHGTMIRTGTIAEIKRELTSNESLEDYFLKVTAGEQED